MMEITSGSDMMLGDRVRKRKVGCMSVTKKMGLGSKIAHTQLRWYDFSPRITLWLCDRVVNTSVSSCKNISFSLCQCQP